MNVLPIKIVDSVEEAPNWARDFIDVRAAEIEQTIIVRWISFSRMWKAINLLL